MCALASRHVARAEVGTTVFVCDEGHNCMVWDMKMCSHAEWLCLRKPGLVPKQYQSGGKCSGTLLRVHCTTILPCSALQAHHLIGTQMVQMAQTVDLSGSWVLRNKT